jgi:hypothetical protein
MGVFVLTDQHQLVPMKSAQFVTEDEFQTLLVKFPELLSGDAAERYTPRRWLLLNREQPVPAEDGGAGRWSIDHLFVDQDGIPTLVEVKRQTDTRLRREVVGQMLDYAANAVVYWSAEQLRADFQSKYPNPEEIIHDRLGPEIDAEVFWQNVKTNIQAGRIRLLFVADQIPSELRRIVEFLNTQMNPAEVLALELQQFEGQGLKTIVPVVYGQTARVIKEPSRPARQWDRVSFFAALTERNDPQTFQVAEKLATWMERNADRIDFGSGAKDGSMIMVVGGSVPCTIWSYGRLEIEFQYLMRSAPFKEETKRVELLSRLNQIDGMNFPSDVITRRPSIVMGSLFEGTRLRDFFVVMDWVVHELKRN